MITKEVFIKIMGQIQKQDKIDKEVSKSLELVCDSWVMFNTKNLKYDALLHLLKEIFNDEGEWIGWWLYETCSKKVIYRNIHTGKDVEDDLTEVEDLYDFLIKNKIENDEVNFGIATEEKNCLNCKWKLIYKTKYKCKLLGDIAGELTNTKVCDKFI